MQDFVHQQYGLVDLELGRRPGSANVGRLRFCCLWLYGLGRLGLLRFSVEGIGFRPRVLYARPVLFDIYPFVSNLHCHRTFCPAIQAVLQRYQVKRRITCLAEFVHSRLRISSFGICMPGSLSLIPRAWA